MEYVHKPELKREFFKLFQFIDKDVSATHYAKWDDIDKAYRVDKNQTANSRVTKLTDEHIYVKKIKKMRVRPAAQVLSQTTASLIQSVIESPDKCSY